MKRKGSQSRFPGERFRSVIAIIGLALLTSGSTAALAQQAESQVLTTTEAAPKLPSGELDSLVAPIALYSDQLLAQTLAASTYPLELIQLQQWMGRNKNLKDKALADAVAKQPWDPSVQGMVAFPDVLQRMVGNIQWTTDLGNAFLAQQTDVMDAVQRMRAKAQGTGNLKTSSQQTVETQTVSSGKQVIAIEPANPDVVYVPSYDPQVVYGPPAPEYPYYPYTYPGYVPGTALAWGAGIALGAAAWGAWGGNWGDCDWNGGDININNNNNFNKNVNRNVNRGQAGQGNKWQHNAQHRGNAPYGDRNTANKFGGRGPGGAGGAGGVGGVGRPGGAGAGGVGGVGRPGGAGGVGGAGRPGGAGWRWWCRKTAVVRAALVVSESPAVPVALVVALVAVELELVRAAAALARGHPRARLAVALRTKSVIAAHRPDLVPLLEAGEDLAVAVVETTREPAVAEAVIA